MAAGTFTFFNAFRKSMADGLIDLDGHSFKMQLHTSTYAPDVEADALLADVDNEVSNANGYTTGGAALTTVVWSRTTVTVKFSSDPVVWTASGAGITARYAILVDVTAAGSPLVGYFLLDSTPADVTATAGNTLTITPNAAGWFTQT